MRIIDSCKMDNFRNQIRIEFDEEWPENPTSNKIDKLLWVDRFNQIDTLLWSPLDNAMEDILR